jgi:hypothetical protein
MKGQIVVLIESFEFNEKVYEVGHQFTIVDTSYRGWDLEDKDGNCIYETLFIQNKFVTLDVARENKLKVLLDD